MADNCPDCDAYVKVNYDLAARLSMAERKHQSWLDSSAGSLASQNLELRDKVRELEQELRDNNPDSTKP